MRTEKGSDEYLVTASVYFTIRLDGRFILRPCRHGRCPAYIDTASASP